MRLLAFIVKALLFLLLLGPRFIAWWIDPSFEAPAGRVLQVLMLSYLIFLPVRGVALPILMGIGKPRLPAIAFLITGIVNLVLSMLLVRPFGLAGVALGLPGWLPPPFVPGSWTLVIGFVLFVAVLIAFPAGLMQALRRGRSA